MKLRSNLPDVIRRLKAYQAGLPVAVRAVIAPEHWKPRLEHVAYKTLRAQWVHEPVLAKHQFYERLTPQIIATLLAQTFAGKTEFSLSAPVFNTVAGLNIAAAVNYNLGNRTAWGKEKKLAIHEPDQQANLDSVRQAIRDFVAFEKRRDERDAGLTDEQIAQRLEEILGVSDRAVPRERTPDMEAAAVELTRAINQWLAGEGESPPVNRPGTPAVTTPGIEPELLRAWLEAVLIAWREYVQSTLRLKVETQLAKLRHRLGTELPL